MTLLKTTSFEFKLEWLNFHLIDIVTLLRMNNLDFAKQIKVNAQVKNLIALCYQITILLLLLCLKNKRYYMVSKKLFF